MDSIRFFIKTLIVTMCAVLFMQIHWGATTIESQTMSFLTSSALVKPIEETAGGAVVLIRNTWSKVTKSINTNFSNALRRENQPGSRGIFNFERSKEYVERKAERASEVVSEAAANPQGVIDGVRSAASRAGHKIQRRLRNNGILEQDIVDETYVPGKSPSDSGVGDSSRDSQSAKNIGADDDAVNY